MPKVQDLIQWNFSPKQAQLICDLNGGWLPPYFFDQTPWAYASTTTITVPTDATTFYDVGDKVRLKQGGGYKYFYVSAVGATTLTVYGGSDYTVANAAITDVEVSKDENPLGFPGAFNWAPTYTGFAVTPTNVVARFFIKARHCFCNVRMGTAGTSNATNFQVSAPLTAATIANQYWGNSLWSTVNNGVQIGQPGVIYIGSGGTGFQLDLDASGALWTNANGKKADFQLWYEVA